MTQPDSSPHVPPARKAPALAKGRGRHRAPRGTRQGGGRRRAALPAVLVTACAAVLAVLALYGTDLATDSTHDLHIPGGGSTTLLRSVLFVALCIQLGEIAGRRLARDVAASLPGGPATPGVADPSGNGPRQPREWAAGAAFAGMIAALGLASMAAAGDGTLTAGLPELSEIYATRDGLLAFLEANGFLLAALCVFLGRPVWAAVPLAGVVLGEALRAHPEADTPAIGVCLTLVHLTSTVLWTGGLIHALRTMRAWHGQPGAARALLAAYAKRAFWLFLAICVTGTFSTLRRLPLDAALSSAYGRTLLVKLAVVALVAVCALVARRVLMRDRTRLTYTEVLRPTAWELAFLSAVLVLSALLTVAPVPPRT
ncbi:MULTISPECIES: CopD family protein [Streptomyces]|uniref:Membrane protein n=1 Tax=Streptomyces cacaoi TaxID=1898 RepID=A0A4Y3QU15_STRCI|nr:MULTISPECIES: CopD family protein [Streptomyces]NNG88182.1 copper resistance protein CopD [Streptomyces cacaoi]GEB48896.1 membrane protein [Streptomyces cacaoi]